MKNLRKGSALLDLESGLFTTPEDVKRKGVLRTWGK